MSRPTQQRTMQQPKPPKQHLTEQEAIAASELFDLFCVATTMRQILGLHRDMCDILGLRPAPINEFYPMLKAKIRSWKAQALWKKFDARAAHRVYAKGTACNGTHVLVIGAGPCGMRTAIEAQLLGAKVVVLEKRDRITRNNVLHLWPFVITDLRNLGAKKFYGKFCAGSIDHISIRQLQIILMKVALLLGVEMHENVSFERTIEPSGDGFGWRAAVTPADHVVSYYEFDVLIGADGKRNTLEGFKRKEFRGKLAIAITANFINKKTEAEAKAEEISGVAFIFNQSFFKELYEKTGIDLENIVYYKDETHYFVMTAKKHSLIDKGVILQDFSDPAELLAPANVSADKLLDYAREAAEFSTKYQMPNLEFAVNHYGKPDVAMFDFTSMFAAETSCRAIVRHGYRLLQCLVGDSLLEPFWPTGSGCARGFLSSMDAAYVTKLWSNPRNSIMGVVAQRESIYRLLNQTTPENLQRDTGSYTVDPASRYPNLNRTAVNPFQVKTLVDSDDPKVFEQAAGEIITTPALAEAPAVLRKPRRSADIVPEALLHWVCTQLHMYDFVKEIKEPVDILTNGKSLCALISRFRPDLIDYTATRDLTLAERNEVAFRILETEYQLPRIMSGDKSLDVEKVDTRLWLHYLNQVREVFRGEVPYLKHPKMDITELREKYRINNAHAQPDFSKLLQLSTKPKYPKAKSPIEDMVDVPQVVQRRSVLDEERVKRVRRHEPATGSPAAVGNSPHQAQTDTPRRAKKRRNAEKTANIEERQKRLQEIEQNREERLSKRRQQRYQQTQNFYKSLQMLQANTLLRESDDPTAFEDYSLFIYRQHAPEFNDRVKELERKLLWPDRYRGDIPSAMPRNNADEQFSDRIKSMEQRIHSKNASGTDKKPKDLMRAIGKIDSSDWNVREIEKKIEQSKRTETHGPKGREKVPKWSKEQFLARQTKMAKPTRQESVEEKFKEIDQTLKNLDKQLKEGSILEVGERGRNKVASIAGQFVKKDDKTSDEKNPSPTAGNVVPKSSAKVALAFKKQAASEKCHFCRQIVYLMEKITAEDLVFHRSCLKCHHCHTNLRLGGYAFDRDDLNGRFYCTQHFRLPAKAIRPVMRKPGQRKPTQQQQQQAAAAAAAAADITVTADATKDGAFTAEMLKTPDKLRGPADSVVQLDLLDRGQTPERIEFENTDAMSDGEPSEEHILDEHEWSGRNFLPESNQDSESDLSSSDDSDSESDADMFEEANDSPLGAQTLQLATDWIGKQHYSDSDDSADFYDSSEGIADDDGKDDTDGEDFKKARELRREEVRLLPLPANLPTDTETEAKQPKENNDNKENVDAIAVEKADETVDSSQNLKKEKDKGSDKSLNSEKSFKSVASSAGDLLPLSTNTSCSAPPPTKADIEKLEQITGRRFSAEIEAINEKLHRLNNVVKMSKDLETIAKENLVKSDILKKLTMKEKWLADSTVGNSNPLAPKSTFENRFAQSADLIELLKNDKSPELIKNDTEVRNQPDKAILDTLKPELKSENADVQITPASLLQQKVTSPEEVLESLKAEIKSASLNRTGSLKRQQLSPTASPSASKKPSANASRSNSFKGKDSSMSEEHHKSGETSRTNSLKRSEKFTSKDEAIANEGRMQIQNILGLVRSTDNKKEQCSNTDIGKLLYNAESKFSPKVDKRLMQEKLKEIEAKSFSGTMDAIKSQMVVPTISSQANLSVDLSKYFPDQKQQKSNSTAVNKNQKNLKDVDLGKYFPSSPTPQRRSAVVTVAEKLKKSQTENAIPTVAAGASASDTTNKGVENSSTTIKGSPGGPKRQASVGNAAFSLRDHQLDGAVDLAKKKTPVVVNKSDGVKCGQASVKTTAATATVTKKGNVKIIKKILPKKKGATTTKKINCTQDNKSIVPRDESDRVLDEILQCNDKEMHSPSAEYLRLFKEEKSPSEDISDKVERLFQETGIDLGIPKRPLTDNKRRLLKTKSLGEGEFERHSLQKDMESDEPKTKEDGDRPTGVQGLLARFESLSSVKSSEQLFKLRRMESTTSNLNKSRDSLISQDSIISRESDTMSDLEKTMEYLKSEWRNEATNFLQKKRDNFFSKKRFIEEEEAAAKAEATKKTKYDDLPVQYRESRISKFFGIKSKSSEKIRTPAKKKTPEKKSVTTTTMKKALINGGITKKSPSPVKEIKSLKKSDTDLRTKTKTTHLQPSSKETNKRKSPSPSKNPNTICEKLGQSTHELSKPTTAPKKSISPPKNQMEDFEISLLVEKGSSASAEVMKLSANVAQKSIEVKANEKDSVKIISNEPNQIADVAAEEITDQPTTVLHENSNNTDTQAPDTPNLKRRPLVEDIRNLPKSGCDKSLSNSRRNSQTSLHSRRCSDVSLQEKLDSAASKLAKSQSMESNSNVDELFENIVESLSNKQTEQRRSTDEDCDSLCTSISKSPSVAPTTVRLRGSSEDESIEKLFSQFSDEMLVNVEFDSNDELIAITPRLPLPAKSEDDNDFVGRLESLEKDNVVETKKVCSKSASGEDRDHNEHKDIKPVDMHVAQEEFDSINPKAVEKPLSKAPATRAGPLTLECIQSMLYMDVQETPFPIRPQRRQKSTSSSSEASAPIAPQRIKHKLATLCPDTMPPSVQDMMQTVFTKSLTAELAANGGISLEKFPRNISEDELEDAKFHENSGTGRKGNPYQTQSSVTRAENPVIEMGNLGKRVEAPTAIEPKISIVEKVKCKSEQASYEATTEELQANNPTQTAISLTVASINNSTELPRNSSQSSLNAPTASRKLSQTLTPESNISSKEPSAVDTSMTESLDLKRKPSTNERTDNLLKSPTTQVTSSQASQVDKTSTVRESSNVPRRLSQSSVKNETLSPPPTPILQRKVSQSSIIDKLSVKNETFSPTQTPLLKRKVSQSSLNDKTSSSNESPVQQRKSSNAPNVALADSPLMQWRLSQVLANAEASSISSAYQSATTEPSTCSGTVLQNGANTDAVNSNSLHSSKDSLNERPNVRLPSKADSKERSLEWDMTKMPASPMPRRKFVHVERLGLEEAKIRDVSPSSSIKMLNNLSSNSSDSEERRIIEDFEMERRQALIQRDKNYQELVKKEKEKANKKPERKKNNNEDKALSSNNSKRSTPLPTPLSSRRGTQDSINTQRDVTPPNFKKLSIPSETDDLASLSSRCSSFAFIELMSNGEPKEAPMPQKLKIPTKPQPIVVPEITEPIAEVFHNRPWPKPELSPEIDTSESPDTVIEVKRANSAPRSPVAEVFRNRKWPDGNTIFDEANEQYTYDQDFNIDYTRNRKKFRKLQSHSPQPSERNMLPTDELSDSKYSSKSITDLRKNSPNATLYDSEHSLNLTARSSRSSAENSSTHTSASGAPKRPQRHIPAGQTTDQIDANTRMLLDRSKRLHNRKSEFINERAAERNPYLRDAVKAERLEREILATSDDELDCYRPRGYRATQRTRFPTLRALGRERSDLSNSYYNYTPTYGTDYGVSSRRMYGNTTLPTSTYSLDYNPYLSSGGAGYGSTSGSSMHFNDYTRRSPSRPREREHYKESCVQSESESSSPEEVELNSATEISTDSEFDHDEMIREKPKIYIDDTHLRKPTKVQVKSTIIATSAGQRHHVPSINNTHNLRGGSYLQKYQVNPPQPQFTPLVQVDPSLLTKNRASLQNPRPGDYLLNKTASTEGIASKKSLELKKRYLLGEQGNSNKIQKSGSTSVLDSRIRSFQSNISECQKLLNPGSGISPSMKTFLDRTKLGENINNDLMRSATTNILNDLKVEITIQKASSNASTDNEKENVFVNSKNELNKGMEYSETVNTALLETVHKKSPSTPTNNHTIMGTIDLVTPEREKASSIIDLTKVADTQTKMLQSNIDYIKNTNVDSDGLKLNSTENNDTLLTADSNKIIDLTCESPVKSDTTIIKELKPDVSKDVKESIPDILDHIGQEVKPERKASTLRQTEDQQHLLSHSCDEEKMDSPEKLGEQFENDTLQIQVPNIPWCTRKTGNMSSTTGSSCTSNSSSIEDIQHYILESTTSPDTQTGGMVISHQVPRVEIHDTSGTLMQIDSLMIIDGKYIGDPDDLKYMEIPEGIVVPETVNIKAMELEDENEVEMEPVTATPEPIECTVIEVGRNKFAESLETKVMVAEDQVPPLPERGPPLPESGPPNIKTVNLKFDTKNENKVESLKNLPLVVDQTIENSKAVKPVTLSLNIAQKSPSTPLTPTMAIATRTPTSPLVDSDVTPTGELMSRGSDSDTEFTGTGQVLTETELSDWTADDCISENFVDMEFVLNSNKGTIKRNKKEKKRISAASKLPSTIEMLGEITKTAPVAEFEGILKSIDIDDIEFMDTGSEGSCAEAYSATNTALLRNRGYMEFIETTPKQTPTHKTTSSIFADSNQKLLAAKRDEKLGIDYIEQGAYILQSEDYEHDLLKTPVNEDPQLVASLAEKSQTTGPPSLMTQSLTDSSTLNDLEDDSLFTATPNSQVQLSAASTTKTTTEESEALTVVTSPLDSSSPKAAGIHNISYTSVNLAELTTGSTPSSSDKNPKTSQSTCTTASTSTATSGKVTPAHCMPHETPAASLLLSANTTGAVVNPNTTSATTSKVSARKPSNELSYEECVRALQQKITQISTARDSDVRKQRRKSSKGEMPTGNIQTVIEPTPSMLQLTESESIAADAPAAAQIHKVPEIPTLTRKLEEITKERTKQKDLIHDLVMDKLQSKKQLNAEKRLHRSRQRTMLTSGYASGSSLSPTPKLAAATTIADTNCTSRAHYHESTAAAPLTATVNTVTEQRASSVNFRGGIPLQKSSTYVSAYGLVGNSPTRTIAYQQRPFSEHLDAEQMDAFERYKLTKTPSFSYVLPTQSSKSTLKEENVYKFPTPIAPSRHNRTQKPLVATQSIDSAFSASTENLRSDARARARLKSNTELGLSPEEKMQLLRQRLHLENVDAKNSSATSIQSQLPIKSPKGIEQNARDRRLSASKSVNDIAYLASTPPDITADVISNIKPTSGVTADFTSDPNLLLSSTSIQSSSGSVSASNKALKGRSSRRQKDPERRKSLIQSLSSFFHKEKKDTGGGNGGGSATSVLGSAQSERPGSSGNNGTAVSVGVAESGVFSRFRISPKTKEKSKEKDGSHFEAQLHSKTCLSNNNLHLNTTPTKYSIKKTSAAAFSSSSPQLFIHRPNFVTSRDIDEPAPPPIPPLPLNYQRSDDESNATETREQKRQRAISKAVRQAELKRLRIAQEIQREQEEIEVQLRELEARGVLIEKALRGEEEQDVSTFETTTNIGCIDEKLLKELLEIWRNIKQLKKRDEELGIRQQELQLEHRHAQLKEELNLRLSCNKLDKSSADVAAEGAILNEMLEIVAKRAALRPTSSGAEPSTAVELMASATAITMSADGINVIGGVDGARGPITHNNDESNI